MQLALVQYAVLIEGIVVEQDAARRFDRADAPPRLDLDHVRLFVHAPVEKLVDEVDGCLR